MKKVLVLWLLIMPMCTFAQESAKETKFDLNIRRIGFDLSKTTVEHPKEYTDSPISAFTAGDQEFIKGVFDTILEYSFDRFGWNNSMFVEYGRTKITKYNSTGISEHTTNENADKILFSSDLSYACWNWQNLKFGPIVRGQYETEFVGDPRRNIIRPNAGFALFDNTIIKDLYIVGVHEYDFTYDHNKTSKLAAEAGWRLEYSLRDGVNFSTDGYYREYLNYSEYVSTDLERDFNAVARLDTNLWGNFTLGPYIKYRRAKARGAEHYGANTSIGVSFSYINKFNLYDTSDKEE